MRLARQVSYKQLLIVFFFLNSGLLALPLSNQASLRSCQFNGSFDPQEMLRLQRSSPASGEFSSWLRSPAAQPHTSKFFIELGRAFEGVERRAHAASLIEVRDQIWSAYLRSSSGTSREADTHFERLINLIIFNDQNAWANYLDIILSQGSSRQLGRSLLVPLALSSEAATKSFILETIRSRYGALNKEIPDDMSAVDFDQPARTAAFIGQWLIMSEFEMQAESFNLLAYFRYMQRAQQVFAGDYGPRHIGLSVKALQRLLARSPASGQPTEYFEIYGSLLTGRARMPDQQSQYEGSDIDVRADFSMMSRILDGVSGPVSSQTTREAAAQRFSEQAGIQLKQVWSEFGENSPVLPAIWNPGLPRATQTGGDINGVFQISLSATSATLFINRPPQFGEVSKAPQRLTTIPLNPDQLIQMSVAN
jgi:hypothetical protein